MSKYIASLVFFFSVLLGHSQDTQFSQYFSASLYLNPGFAGVYSTPTLSINTKRQTPTTEMQLELTQVSFIFPIKPEGQIARATGGVGIMAFSEKSGYKGVYQNAGAYLTYAHNLTFGLLASDAISIGVQAGFESRSTRFAELNWGSQYNPFLGFDDTRIGAGGEFDSRFSNLVVNAGIMYYYNPERNYLLYNYSAFSGLSVTNLNRPNRAFSKDVEFKEAMLWKYNGGVELKFNKILTTPSLLFQYANGNYQFNAGMLVSFAPSADRYRIVGPQLLVGSWYRFRDSFIFMAGVQVRGFVVRGSYDMNTKFLLPDREVDLTRNAFEISVQYSLGGGNQALRKVSNPLF